MPGVRRIGPKRPRRLFIAEWRENRGLTQKQLGLRLGVSDMTVSRWERATNGQARTPPKGADKGTAEVNWPVIQAIAEALDIEPDDLFRHPDQPSANALLRDQPSAIRDQAIAIIRAIRK